MEITLLLIFCVFLWGTCQSAPSDLLTCQGVANRRNYLLKNCYFLNETTQISETTRISCQFFLTAQRGTQKPLVVSAGMVFTTQQNTVNNVNNVVNNSTASDDSLFTCLSMHSAHLQIIENLPEDAKNVFNIPIDVTSLGLGIETIKEFSSLVEFDSNATTVAFLQLSPQCQRLKHPLRNSSCISSLYSTSFITLPDLTDFSDFLSSGIPDFYFKTLAARMTSVRLVMNHGPELRSWIPSLKVTKVRDLDVSNNHLNGRLRNHMDGMTSLTHLSLRDCRINKIDQGTFTSGAVNLEVLDLSENQFSSPPEGLSSLSHLMELNLSSQNIDENFDLHQLLRNLTSITHLDISNNKLAKISRESLPKSAIMSTLNLGNCSLTVLPVDLFSDLVGLRVLQLSGNPLSHLSTDVFAKLRPPSVIHVRDTNIATSQTLKVRGQQVQVVGIDWVPMFTTVSGAVVSSVAHLVLIVLAVGGFLGV